MVKLAIRLPVKDTAVFVLIGIAVIGGLLLGLMKLIGGALGDNTQVSDAESREKQEAHNKRVGCVMLFPLLFLMCFFPAAMILSLFGGKFDMGNVLGLTFLMATALTVACMAGGGV